MIRDSDMQGELTPERSKYLIEKMAHNLVELC